MEALFLLIPLSLLAVLVAILVFFRMSSSGQFDDDQGPAFSILLDDDRPPERLESATARGERPASERQAGAEDADS